MSGCWNLTDRIASREDARQHRHQWTFEQQEYVIEKIKTTIIKGGQVKYLVSWKGYEADEDTWEPHENLKDAGEHVVRQFHLDNPRKPQDPEVLL